MTARPAAARTCKGSMLGLAMLGLAALTGCAGWANTLTFGGPKGELAIKPDTPADEGPAIEGRFDTAVYAAEDSQTLHALLIAGPIDDPQQVAHLRMFWKPMAGRTPFDPSATNCSVRYIVFRDGEVGLYGGGGLLQPKDTPGADRFDGVLRNATLRLMDATEGFDRAPIGANALAEGKFDAEHNRIRTLRLLRQVSQVLEDRLGYPRMVGRFDGLAAAVDAMDESSSSPSSGR